MTKTNENTLTQLSSELQLRLQQLKFLNDQVAELTLENSELRARLTLLLQKEPKK